MARRKFRPKDWATIKYGEYAGRYCRISMLERGGDYVVIPYDASDEPCAMITLNARAMDRLEPVVISGEELADLVTARTMYSDYKDRVFPAFNIVAAEDHVMTAADIRDALCAINTHEDCLKYFKEWFWVILNVFYGQLHIEERYEPDFFSDAPENEDEMFSVAYGMAEKLYWRIEERFGQKEEIEKYVIRFAENINWESAGRKHIEEAGYKAVSEDIISRVNVFEFNQSRPEGKTVYSSSEKKHIISGYDSPSSLNEATPEALDVYREFVEDLYNEGDILATKSLAWGYFDGNAAFSQDWELAQKYMSEFFEKTGDPYAANALGYICYYGFTSHNIPQYHEAFRYFSYGALAGVDESCYRASDMLIEGKGTVKNIDMGLNLLVDGYRDAMHDFCEGHYGNKLPEYALRMGNACRKDLIYGMNMRDAYKFYLEADFALKKRRSSRRRKPGDSSTELKIAFELKKIRERFALEPAMTSIRTDFPLYLSQLFEDRYPLKVELNVPRGKDTGTLKVSRYRIGKELAEKGLLPEHGEASRFFRIPEMLVAFPELSCAYLVSEMTYRLENVVVAQKTDKGPFFLADGFRKNDKTNALEFFSNGRMVAAIDAQWYVIDTESFKKEDEK